MIPWASPSPQSKQYHDQFRRLRTGDHKRPYTLQWAAPPPLKLPIPMGWSGPQSNTWFPGPSRVLNINEISIGAAVFAGLTSVTDRPTDHTTRSVTIGSIYVHSIAMRPNNYYYNYLSFTAMFWHCLFSYRNSTWPVNNPLQSSQSFLCGDLAQHGLTTKRRPLKRETKCCSTVKLHYNRLGYNGRTVNADFSSSHDSLY